MFRTAFSRLSLIDFGRKAHLFAAQGPAYHYAYSRWRLGLWLQKIAPRSFDADDESFLSELDLSRPALNAVKEAGARGDTPQALARLTDYFRTRTEPRFFFDQPDCAELVSLIPDASRQATLRAADDVCQNLFEFRGASPIRFETGIDWTHRPGGNIDWTWDLNRHAYFETLGRAYRYTGDERYARKFREILLDWSAHNPAASRRPGWSSVFEVAFRVNVWAWALYYFRSAEAFDWDTGRALLKGLLTHGRYLDAHLEWHVPNNHLLLEAKALAFLGLLCPEFKRARRWRQRGLNTFYRQIREQVCTDGVHGERATHYHRVIAGELLELLVLMHNNHLSAPADVVETLQHMIEFELWITKPDRLIPLLGDSALQDTHLRFSAADAGSAFLGRDDLSAIAPPLDEAGIWLLGAERARPHLDRSTTRADLGSRAFPAGGYFVMRAGAAARAAYLVFDCGPFGYARMPNHGHADALSIELHACERTLLIDPGVYSTSLGQNWRHFFRGTRAHNTVVVDDCDQSILLDARRVYRPARATLHRWSSDNTFDFVDGSHDGYTRLSGPITHRRQIFFAKPEYWVVIDMLTGRGRHCFDVYFHLTLDAQPDVDAASRAVRTSQDDEPGLLIAPLAADAWQVDVMRGTTDPIQGWLSLFSGEKRSAPVVRYRREDAAPLQFCTVLYPYRHRATAALAISAVPIEIAGTPDRNNSLTAVRIETSAHVDYLMIDRGPIGTHKAFAEYETDAQLVFTRRSKTGLLPISAVARGGRYLSFQGQPIDPADADPANLDSTVSASRAG